MSTQSSLKRTKRALGLPAESLSESEVSEREVEVEGGGALWTRGSMAMVVDYSRRSLVFVAAVSVVAMYFSVDEDGGSGGG